MSCLLCGKVVYSRGLCRTDYLRERKRGNLEKYPKTRKVRGKCTRDFCDEIQTAKGLCSSHYWAKKQRDLRTKIFNAYGHFCSCCGISQYEFLTIDHVNNDGAQDRRNASGSNRSNDSILRRIIEENYPDRYQVLCWNCNASKQYHNGCPHSVLYAQPPS